MTTPAIPLRHPSTQSPPSTSSASVISAPPLTWLTATWNVTHSTLPMWRKARNVRITYTPLPSSAGAAPQLDDLVSYQSLSSTKVKTVKGVDTSLALVGASESPGATDQQASLSYKWRGKGLLMVATSQWEILGWGDESSSTVAGPANDEPNSYVVTYFAKTLFTPAGVDVYARRGRLREETLEGIRVALRGVGGELGKLTEGLFEVGMDVEGTKGL